MEFAFYTRAMGKEIFVLRRKTAAAVGYCRSFFVFERFTMSHSGRNNIYEAIIRRMVAEALENQERQFFMAHEHDSDEALLAYLCQWAQRLGHTPWPREIPGSSLILQRFQSWEHAVSLAGLPGPETPDRSSDFARVREERLRQQGIYREKKARKKLRAQLRRKVEG